MLSGSRSVIECVPTCAMTSNGPRYFSTSFLDGQVVRKIVLYEGMGASQEIWGRGMTCVCQGLVAGLSCPDLFFQCAVWSSSRSMANLCAFLDANSLSGWSEIFG